jgi:hypothetical protein
MRCRTVKFASLLVVVISFAFSGIAQTISAVPEDVTRYAHNMNRVISSAGPVSLEKVFEEGLSAAEALEPKMERFDEPTFQKVKIMMPGFSVNRMEVIFAEPDTKFYLKLAREKGTKSDQAFFETLRKTYPNGVFAAYIKQITDYGGCRIFDGKTLSDIYGLWLSFQKTYPNLYRSAVQKELKLIESALESECVCDGEDAYRREMQYFLKTYPTSPFKPMVASRLEAFDKKAIKIRFQCVPR